MQQPEDCPDEISAIMQLCLAEYLERPAFLQILDKLQLLSISLAEVVHGPESSLDSENIKDSQNGISLLIGANDLIVRNEHLPAPKNETSI